MASVADAFEWFLLHLYLQGFGIHSNPFYENPYYMYIIPLHFVLEKDIEASVIVPLVEENREDDIPQNGSMKPR